MEARSFFSQYPNFRQARTALYKKGIKMSYEPVPEEQVISINNAKVNARGKRLVLSLTSIAEPCSLTQECNGLVLERDSWAPLVIPVPCSHNTNVSNIVEKCLRDNRYNIYPLLDGTTVNLYFFQGSWRLSTTHSYELTNAPYVGTDITYQDMFESATGLKLVDLPFDRNYSYTFMLTHPDIHLYWKSKLDKPKATFIMKANLSDFTRVYGEFPEEKSIECQMPIETDANSIGDLLKMGEEKDPHFMGWILRSKDPSITNDVSYVTLESDRYRFIRKNLYDRELVGKLSMHPEFDRTNFLLLHACLHYHASRTFVDMFPQFAELCREIKQRKEMMVNHLVVLYENAQLQNPKPASDVVGEKHASLLESIKSNIDKILTIDTNQTYNTKKILSDWISQEYADQIYPFIFTV